MKKTTILISLIACSFIKVAGQQNLVPNPSFESVLYSTPCYSTRFDAAINNWKVAVHNIERGNGLDPSIVNRQSTGQCFPCASGQLNQAWFCIPFINQSHFFPSDKFVIIQEYSGNGHEQSYHSAIRVSLTENLIPNETYVIRMKILAMRKPGFKFSDMCDQNYHHDDITDASDGKNHLRVFFSKFGEDWRRDFRNQKFEAINANYVKQLPSTSGCSWGSWEEIERNFTVPSNLDELQNLILYVEDGRFAIDDVEINRKCASEVFIQNRIINPFRMFTQNDDFHFFSKGNMYVGVNGPVVVHGNAIFKAQNSVELLPGFSTEEYANVIVEIGNDCSSFRTANPDSTNTTTTLDNVVLDNLNLSNTIISENKLNDFQKLDTIAITKIEKWQATTLSIYPNPNNGLFILEMINVPNGNYNLQITDALGRSVIEQKINVQEQKLKQNINLQQFGKGIYFVKINNEQLNEVRKVVVE